MMTIVLNPEQERVLMDAIHSGLAHTPEEALDQALQTLKDRLPPQQSPPDPSYIEAVRRLATFGERYGLSLGDITIKELLNESRP